jgi:hypothetical protein
MTETELPPRVRALVESLVPVICPPEASELGLAGDHAAHVALTVGAMPRAVRAALLLGLRAYDEGARLWLPARGRPARALPAELADRYYERWEHGPTPAHTQLARALGQLLKLAHYEHPAVQERLGYRPAAWVEQVQRRRLAVYGAEVRAAEAAVIAPDPLRPTARSAGRDQRGRERSDSRGSAHEGAAERAERATGPGGRS